MLLMLQAPRPTHCVGMRVVLNRYFVGVFWMLRKENQKDAGFILRYAVRLVYC